MTTTETETFFQAYDYSESFHRTTAGYQELFDVYFRSRDGALEAAKSFLGRALEGGWSVNRVYPLESLRNLQRADFEGYPLIQEALYDVTRPLLQQFVGAAIHKFEVRESRIDITDISPVYDSVSREALVEAKITYEFRVKIKDGPKVKIRVIDGIVFRAEIPNDQVSYTEWAPLLMRIENNQTRLVTSTLRINISPTTLTFRD